VLTQNQELKMNLLKILYLVKKNELEESLREQECHVRDLIYAYINTYIYIHIHFIFITLIETLQSDFYRKQFSQEGL
jgi:hypothetical protein